MSIQALPDPVVFAVLEHLAAASPRSLWNLYHTSSSLRTALSNATPRARALWATAYRALLDSVSLTFPPPDWPRVLARRHFHLVFFATLAQTALDRQDLAFALLIAIAGNRPAMCRKLIDAGAALQQTGSWLPDPLHYAAEAGCSTVCTMLVQAGDAVNREHPRFGRPLERAVMGRQFATCQILLKLGATKKENATLTDAIAYNDLDLCDWLLAQGADPNAPDKPGGDPPLYVAALVGNDEMCKHLVSAGAELVPQATQPTQSPLLAAIAGANVLAFKALLAMGKAYGVLHKIAPALFLEACRRGQADMVQQLRSSGTYKDVDMNALLSAAIDAGHADVCRVLLSDIDFEVPDEVMGNTPLHRAAWARSPACCEVLVAAGANVNAENKGKDTPLHIAVESGSLELCEALVMLGANVNAQNRSGESPLHYAAMHGFTSICTFLAENGAHLYAQNAEGNNPLHVAVESGSYPTCACFIYEIGVDVNAVNRAGNTPLHLAAMCAYLDICELLVSQGALINAINHEGATPLDYASVEKGSPIGTFLANHGALVSSQLGKIVHAFRLRMMLEA
ncbi:hypothetical protein HK105_203087 [Polyrhizophydium stewartii]|uniref:Ankyrin repeat protein n=1 Tax=Polyrhizophydium stewartii TaxID=2732419 RepID=A0ABR4ND15_9FUNG|nr:hypothetical protein HK105_003862 [Polyrhizophydium stewartii]